MVAGTTTGIEVVVAAVAEDEATGAMVVCTVCHSVSLSNLCSIDFCRVSRVGHSVIPEIWVGSFGLFFLKKNWLSVIVNQSFAQESKNRRFGLWFSNLVSRL